MKRLLLLLLFALPAQAGEVTLSWTPPLEQVTNCTTEPIQGLAGYRIYKLMAELTDPAQTEEVITNLEVGEHTFAATAYNEAGEESMLSGAASKTVEALVVVETNAYDLLKRDNRLVTLRVGSVPLGTPCDFTQRFNDLYVVPVDAVTFEGGRPPVVFAKCG